MLSDDRDSRPADPLGAKPGLVDIPEDQRGGLQGPARRPQHPDRIRSESVASCRASGAVARLKAEQCPAARPSRSPSAGTPAGAGAALSPNIANRCRGVGWKRGWKRPGMPDARLASAVLPLDSSPQHPNLAWSQMSVPTLAQETPQLTQIIGGEALPASSGEQFDSIDPHDGSVLARVPRGNKEDARRAITAARRAFDDGPWPRMPILERKRLIYALADQLESHADELAMLETRDTGRPIATTSMHDVERAALNLRFFADYAASAAHDAYPSDSHTSYVNYPPAGVVTAISPWNLPLMLSTWKVAPALAFGNTVVLKPAEQTPMTVTRLAELALDAGLPEGVLNVVHGFGPGEVGEALTSDPRVDRITFTGASATGQAIMAAASRNLTPVSFELGGRSANVVFDDADLDLAIAGAIKAIFLNNGEMCLAGSRLLVQRGILDEFTERFVAQADSMRVGDPKHRGTDMGPLIEREHLEKVLSYIELGRSEGGKILTGGTKLHGDLAAGNYLRPTVLTGLTNAARSVREEIFGPVQMILPFDAEEEALKIANDSSYGLAGMLWTNNLDRVHQMARHWRAGTLWVNCFFERDLRLPFGGVGASGIGREGGQYSREFFTEPQAVTIRHHHRL